MKEKTHSSSEKGAVTIIEAALVFPIAFFVVFFMVMAGEAYYQNACVEYAVTKAAISGAARCENPMLDTVMESGVPTSPTASRVMPYRYIFTGNAQGITGEIRSELEEKVAAMQPLLFRNMKPEDVNIKIDLKMNPLISSFPVTCDFKVPFPIRMIFSDRALQLSYTVNMTATIGDPAEFIRNVALVADMLERSEFAATICEKFSSAMDTVGSYIN